MPERPPAEGRLSANAYGDHWQDQPVAVEHDYTIGYLKEYESLFLEQPCQY